MKRLLLLALGILVVRTAHAQAPVFQEDFGTLADGIAITTSNTGFTYVRIGTGGGLIEAQNPSSVFEGTVSNSASILLGGTSSGSLNGIGRGDDLPASDVTTLSFALKLTENAADGNVFVGMGTGSMFTGNGTFVTSQLLWGIQSNNGALESRTTGWNSVGFTLTEGSTYLVHIIANGSESPETYTSGSVAAGAGVERAFHPLLSSCVWFVHLRALRSFAAFA